MKHQYEDYIKFCEKEIAKRKRIFEGLVRPIPDQLNSYHDVGIASLLANKATLERHKPVYQPEENANGTIYVAFWACAEKTCWHKTAKEDDYCPSLLDVTNQLDEVME